MLPFPPIPAILDERKDWTVPSPEWEAWARETFIEGDGPLVDESLGHLAHASIGFLLTNATKKKGGRRWAGSGGAVTLSGDGWSKAQQAQRYIEWFGHIPDFVCTFDIKTFETRRYTCFLVRHELKHCGQDAEPDGSPKFDDDGRPVWCTAPHYAELNEGDLRLWGADVVPGGETIRSELALPPLISDAMLEFDAEEAGEAPKPLER